MTTGNTTLLGLALPVEGELDGTWGDTVNDSITSLVDSAVAGTTTLSTDADVTLTDTVLAANQARQAILRWTASNGATTRNITAPARSKPYIVINAGTGSIVLRGAGPTTGITIIAGEKCVAAWSGSDFVKVASTAISNLTGTLPVANGGTGLTTLTANNVILGNGTSTPSFVAPDTTGNVLTSNGTTWTSAALPTFSQVYPGAGVAVSTGTAWTTSLTAPSGALVGTTDSQTLTNKTIEAGTFTNGYTEEVYALGTSGSLALNPANGTIQTCALTGNPTFTDSLAAGQSIVLMLTNGASYTVTFPTITWVTSGGNTAPTLTAADTLVFWKISTTLYGAYAGSYE